MKISFRAVDRDLLYLERKCMMPVEPFDVSDENGVRVIGAVEAYRDRKGPFYDPTSKFYQNPRFFAP
jgi:hypothetical protein